MKTDHHPQSSNPAAKRTAALLLLLLGTLGQCALAGQSTNEYVLSWGPTTNGCQLGIEFAKTNFIMGERIVATIRLRNLGQATFGYTGTGSPYYFGITFLGPDGKPVKKKSADPTGFFGEELDRSGSYRWIRVAPGEDLKIDWRLDNRFVLAPGEYTVSLSHVLADLTWTNRFRLTSGSVQIHMAR